VNRQVVQGPGSLRVGRFIGRLGVVSLPAVQAGLGLDQRVLRRHVAKLQAAGWLARAPWVLGEGSAAWPTGTGVEGAGLGGLRAVKSPPAPTTISHGVLVGWSAARIERRPSVESSARACGRPRAVGSQGALRARLHRAPARPGGVGQTLRATRRGDRRERRPARGSPEDDPRGLARRRPVRTLRIRAQAHPSPRWISRLAKKVWLTAPDFSAVVQMSAEEIAALTPAGDAGEPAVSKHEAAVAAPPRGRQNQIAPVRTPLPLRRRRSTGPRHRRQSPRRPRPPPSGSGVIGRSLGSPSQEPAVGGDAEARVSSLAEGVA
jgi:hypothetical protein